MNAAEYILSRRISRINRRIRRLKAVALTYPQLESRSVEWMQRLRQTEEKLLKRLPIIM